MQTIRITIVTLLLFAAAASAQVYKWIDENGVVHYSDQPTPGAERIDLGKRQSGPTVQRPKAAPAKPEKAAKPAVQQAFAYKAIAISSPVSEQSLWNIGGVLNVSVSLTPGLRSGDRIRLYFDGTPQMIVGTGIELREVWRGTHNLQAEVLDSSGKALIRSEPIRFYVKQTSVLN